MNLRDLETLLLNYLDVCEYTYSEDELPVHLSIEGEDEVKERIETQIISEIINQVVYANARPDNPKVYEYILAMADSLQLKDVVGISNYNHFLRNLKVHNIIKDEIITVQDLINALNDIEDKSLPVYIYDTTEDRNLMKIDSIDDTISDRVDINIKAG